jgi:hypothetical protein
MEDPLAKLGIYSAEEDTNEWTFEQLFDDTQWQEQHLTLEGEPRVFSGPLPGIIQPGPSQRDPCTPYFLRFWPAEVLERIMLETNKYVKL